MDRDGGVIPAAVVGIFPYAGTPEQDLQLGQCAAAWQEGQQPFWSLSETQSMLAGDSCRAFFAATSEDAQWHGVVLVEVTAEWSDLLYLYVPQAHRRNGIARLLLLHLLERARGELPSPAVILEVRPSNQAAWSLYQSLGFVEVGRRKAYYSNGEDALVLKHLGYEVPWVRR